MSATEHDYQAGVDAFDEAFYRRFGRYPDESPRTAAPVQSSERRRRIAALAEQGSTEGERAAARAALDRFDVSHGEHDRMQRGGNWIE